MYNRYRIGKTGIMTMKEVEALIRQQISTLTDPNPYVNDYYQYAMLTQKALAKLGGGESAHPSYALI